MIKVWNLKKTYYLPHATIEAIRNVDISIKKGEIFGIVGFSGAGKSTLIRCINRLEEPDCGTIHLDGVNILSLSKKKLLIARRQIGMIFQHFNLFDSMTVFENIAYPLEIAGNKKNINERVNELLKIVGLEDKINSYPGQLSGGQKQRVSIARALANNPSILLCDEATSALDPLTTHSILELLRDINKRFGITILLITHELDVVSFLCDRVAVMENGVIVEQGSVENVFTNPQSDTAKRFISITAQFRASNIVRNGECI